MVDIMIISIVAREHSRAARGAWRSRSAALTPGETRWRRCSRRTPPAIGPHGFHISKRKNEDDFLLRIFVANRDLPLFLGIGSMTATWVGGGYLNGTAEAVYKFGITNCHTPIGYAMSLVLGDTASVIIRVDASYFIIISGAVIFLYTSLGGLYSVTAVGTLDAQYTDWIGTISSEDITQHLDFFLMTALGGIPWQVYFQRVLACPSVMEAKILSFMAAIGCIFLAVPPVLIGITAKHTNFTIAGYPHSYELNDVDKPRVLPFTILYLTSGITAIFGLISIAAAVMSSADSSMLSASTMITRNVYQALLRPTATELEVVITLRIMICAMGSLSVYMALSVNSVFDLWTLCSDIVYVLLFPQLLCVFYFKETNAYGSVLAFIVGGVFRCLCGEPSMNVPVVVRLPLYDPDAGQRFPFRLLCMALGLCTLLIGSFAATTPSSVVACCPIASTCSTASSSARRRRSYGIPRSTKPRGWPAREPITPALGPPSPPTSPSPRKRPLAPPRGFK
ncbi:hypothetical protein MTO96_009255 [Rhipicephalus appendiculatus]